MHTKEHWFFFSASRYRTAMQPNNGSAFESYAGGSSSRHFHKSSAILCGRVCVSTHVWDTVPCSGHICLDRCCGVQAGMSPHMSLCQRPGTLHQPGHPSVQSQQMNKLLHPFNGLLSRTTWASRHQKGKQFWILLEQEMMGWQWHQLDHTQIFAPHSRQITTPVPHHSVFTGWTPFLLPNQQ